MINRCTEPTVIRHYNQATHSILTWLEDMMTLKKMEEIKSFTAGEDEIIFDKKVNGLKKCKAFCFSHHDLFVVDFFGVGRGFGLLWLLTFFGFVIFIDRRKMRFAALHQRNIDGGSVETVNRAAIHKQQRLGGVKTRDTMTIIVSLKNWRDRFGYERSRFFFNFRSIFHEIKR